MSQTLQAANRPSESEYRSVRNYLDGNAPLHHREQEFIQYKKDLITLRPGRDHAWLDRRIERALQVLHRPFPWLNVRTSEPRLIQECCCFPAEPDRLANHRPLQRIFSSPVSPTHPLPRRPTPQYNKPLPTPGNTPQIPPRPRNLLHTLTHRPMRQQHIDSHDRRAADSADLPALQAGERQQWQTRQRRQARRPRHGGVHGDSARVHTAVFRRVVVVHEGEEA